MITTKEAELIESRFFDAFELCVAGDKNGAIEVYDAWKYLWSYMVKENNYSDKLGSKYIDWQIGNWINDTTMELHNAGLYKEEIEVNKQILNMRFEDDSSNVLFHENAKRDMADAYSDMGDIKKCMELYDEYLSEDPMWGWAWIGYFRQLKDQKDKKFADVLDELYNRIKEGEPFRDKEDLLMELQDEYRELGETGKADDLEHMYKEINNSRNRFVFPNEKFIIKKTKIYPNEPCPCGSGKKYKKCCSKK